MQTMKATSIPRPMTSSSGRTLVLYVRVDCHLCETMHRELLTWQTHLGFGLNVIDIDDSAELVERFDYKVPVLTEGAVEICHHFLDEDMLRAHFDDPLQEPMGSEAGQIRCDIERLEAFQRELDRG